MSYCPRCGVEAEATATSCPLCATPLPSYSLASPAEPAWPRRGQLDAQADPVRNFANAREVRLRALALVLGLVAVAALVVAVTDGFTAGGISWSRYPLLSLAAFALGTMAVAGGRGRPLQWGSSLTLVTLGFLAGLDLADDGQVSWYLSLGLPITMVSFLLVLLGGVMITRLSLRGWNLLALTFALVAVGLFCFDALITHGTTSLWALGWSVVTALVLIPLSLVFLLLHLLIRRTPDFRRIFHF